MEKMKVKLYGAYFEHIDFNTVSNWRLEKKPDGVTILQRVFWIQKTRYKPNYFADFLFNTHQKNFFSLKKEDVLEKQIFAIFNFYDR